jgi:hypothetical protein
LPYTSITRIAYPHNIAFCSLACYTFLLRYAHLSEALFDYSCFVMDKTVASSWAKPLRLRHGRSHCHSRTKPRATMDSKHRAPMRAKTPTCKCAAPWLASLSRSARPLCIMECDTCLILRLSWFRHGPRRGFVIWTKPLPVTDETTRSNGQLANARQNSPMQMLCHGSRA